MTFCGISKVTRIRLRKGDNGGVTFCDTRLFPGWRFRLEIPDCVVLDPSLTSLRRSSERLHAIVAGHSTPSE
jgi:hypothetical protein